MKTNKGWIIGLAVAGAAIAGAVIYLTTTKTGKQTMKKWSVKGKRIAEQTEDLIKGAKKKFENLKSELASKDGEVVAQPYE